MKMENSNEDRISVLWKDIEEFLEVLDEIDIQIDRFPSPETQGELRRLLNLENRRINVLEAMVRDIIELLKINKKEEI
jgi:hypothetical protein